MTTQKIIHMTSKYYDSTIMHSVKDSGANIEDGGLSNLSEQEKKRFLIYVQKIKALVGEGKIIQEEKKTDAFDAEIYFRKLKGAKLTQANLVMKVTFIERTPATVSL